MKARMLFLFVTLAAFSLSAFADDKPKSDQGNAKPKEEMKASAKDKDKVKDAAKPAPEKLKAKDAAKSAEMMKAKDAAKDTGKMQAKEAAKPADKAKAKDVAKAAPAAQPLPKGPVPGDAIDFVYLSDVRPLFVRLHVQIDGKPVEESWQESIKELFAYLDRNGDGVLTKDEAEKAPPAGMLTNPNVLYGGITPVSMSQLDSNKDGKVTLEELTRYYRASGFPPFSFQTGPVQQQVYYDAYGQPQNQGNMAEQLNSALFALLDTNKDGKLSRDELAAAEKVLLSADTNEDEMVTVEELLPNMNRMNRRGFIRRAGVQPAPSNNDFFLLNPSDPPAKLARQILAKYGRKSSAADQKLTRKQIGLDQTAFDELDLDKNGELDTKELERFAKRTPDLEMIARHGKGRGTGPLEVLARKDSPDSLASTMKSNKGTYFLDLGTTRLELRGSAGSAAARASAANVRSIYIMQFKMLDPKNRGYLEQKDVRQNPYLSNTFKMMDRDNDGKLTEKEMLAWIDKITDLQNKAITSCASLSVSDQGRGLFDLIDTSHDGRLSVREMRNAPKLIAQLDRDGDGQLSREEIPRNFLLSMGHGPASSNQVFAPPVAFNPYGMNSAGKPNLTAGPLWFRKMDRNRDGDVSRKEFLGTDEEFDRIDTDHDGLISLQEAEAFDRQMRAQKVAAKP